MVLDHQITHNFSSGTGLPQDNGDPFQIVKIIWAKLGYQIQDDSGPGFVVSVGTKGMDFRLTGRVEVETFVYDSRSVIYVQGLQSLDSYIRGKAFSVSIRTDSESGIPSYMPLIGNKIEIARLYFSAVTDTLRARKCIGLADGLRKTLDLPLFLET